jgi:hypothetical protein
MKNQVESYLQQENFTDAIYFCEQCIDREPNLIYSYWYLGLCWLLQGDETQAESIWLSTFSDENWNLKEEDVKEFLEILKKQANQYLSVQKPELSQLIYTVLLAGQTLAVACQTAAPEANNPVTPPSLTSTSATCTGTMTNMD